MYVPEDHKKKLTYRQRRAQNEEETEYNVFPEATRTKLLSLDSEQFSIYNIIMRNGRAGIWTRDIKSQSGKHQISVNKILRHLEGRQLVKAFKSIKSPSKKYYMLYDLSIPAELGGGVFYTDQQFDFELIATLRHVSLKILFDCARDQAASAKNASFKTKVGDGARAGLLCSATALVTARFGGGAGMSLDQLCSKMNDLGVLAHHKLNVREVKQIVDTLVADGQVERVESTSGRGMAAAPVTTFRICNTNGVLGGSLPPAYHDPEEKPVRSAASSSSSSSSSSSALATPFGTVGGGEGGAGTGGALGFGGCGYGESEGEEAGEGMVVTMAADEDFSKLSFEEKREGFSAGGMRMATAALTECPCGVCPVSKQCCEGGVISPSTCVYMATWLGLPSNITNEDLQW